MPVQPNACAYNPLIHALAVLDDMLFRGCAPDVVTYNILLEATCNCASTMINGLVKASKVEQALELLNEMGHKGFNPDKIYQLLAECLNEEDKFEGAIRAVCKLQDTGTSPHTVLYNAILLGLCRNGKTEFAIDIMAYMVSTGCMPDDLTYVVLIEALKFLHVDDDHLFLLGRFPGLQLFPQKIVENLKLDTPRFPVLVMRAIKFVLPSQGLQTLTTCKSTAFAPWSDPSKISLTAFGIDILWVNREAAVLSLPFKLDDQETDILTWFVRVDFRLFTVAVSD
ncbi:hypothetical protein ABZP36_007213 [Zizania latifolia]